MPTTRRTFLVNTGAAAAAATLVSTTRAADVNSTLRAAIIGVNGRGKSHMEGFSKCDNVKVVAFCDPDQKVCADRAREYEEKYGDKVEQVSDMRRIFERKDIDVVSIATPNHWHTLAAIWACQAGKDVYLEKPGTHNLYEGKQLQAAVKKYGRIVQHGVQLRSNPEFRRAVQLLNEGVIGDVYLARGLVFKDRPSVNHLPDAAPPATLDWNLWQGPAAERPFSTKYVHYNWHWHWDFGNGDIGNQGVHEIDMCLWGLGVGMPSEISSMGGKFLWDDDRETPERLISSYLYPEQKKMIEIDVRPWRTNTEADIMVGNIFYGSKGYMLIRGYNGFETYLGAERTPGPKGNSGEPTVGHFRNFIAAVRSRDAASLHGPVETAHTSSAIAHLGNISHRLGRRLKFSPESETFVGDAEADALLTRQYREGFVVPEAV